MQCLMVPSESSARTAINTTAALENECSAPGQRRAGDWMYAFQGGFGCDPPSS